LRGIAGGSLVVSLSILLNAGLLYPATGGCGTHPLYQGRGLPVTDTRSLSPGRPQSPGIIHDTLRHAIPDSREIFLSMFPWHWKRHSTALIIAGVTVPLAWRKEEVQEFVSGKEGDSFAFVDRDALYTHLEPLGGHLIVPAISGMFLLGGLIGGSRREVETGTMLVESLVFTGIPTLLGQFIFSERRPSDGGNLRFFQIGGHGVSGHAAISSSIVRPLESQYLTLSEDDQTSVTIFKCLGKGILYGSPLMVGISRVRSNRHYVWNVVLGLSAGYFTGDLVVRVHRHRRDRNRIERVLHAWRLSPGPGGISVTKKW